MSDNAVMSKIVKMSDVPLAGRRVLIREDLNVPMKDGRITSEARLLAALPTLKAALAANAAVLVVSHLGRPTEGVVDENLSLAPIAKRLAELLGTPVDLVKGDWANVRVKPGQIALAWVLALGDHIIPIPGTKRLKYLAENLAASEITLSEQDLAELSAIEPPTGLRYPELAMAYVAG